MKRFKTAVVVGKFYPPHHGHKLLIDAARAESERVSVLVCWKPEQTIPIAVRAECLRRTHPDADVIEVADTLDDDDSRGWAEYTRSLLGYTPEAVFTSEDYGDAYAYYLGCQHVQVDKARKTVPCSGTQIRRDPLNHLHHMEPCMRAWYVPRVCVLGAESTGTTTLARALAAHYRTNWVAEYGREYSEQKMTGPVEGDWSPDEFKHIALEQCRREDEAAGVASPVLICDTDPLATGVWHQRYLGTRNPEVEQLAACRRYALHILTGDEIPFVQDGWRDGEHIRHDMHRMFIDALDRSGRTWMLVRGTHEERMACAVQRIEGIIAGMKESSHT